ncbi:SMP-30/gluconolactonase/LRE family protein [Caldivirga maquilingensis]|uniref:SMP-30/Gluconolaconase/LRE domain protein n=1 Tax=Caldivirga maquilingensis (strain ATCC 700844 / DSM 13496 / JCM 10307 / IC-167) TaxID=397948 RepID=A8M9P8_CALMQ|nr:SMP-30/gluconolactonase/LRE family protein [Caldivirga maquilingensis]ABW00929.1 SMP-30/Gluconolaconase/LRE domain protein [Caldivirga maquilingensis IC-167]
MSSESATPLINLPRSRLGEGPIWDHVNETLYWVDINGDRVHMYKPKDGYVNSIKLGPMPSCIALNSDGNLVVTIKNKVILVNPNNGVILKTLANVDEGADNRFNDCRCDPFGRLVAGTMYMPMPRKPQASLYIIDHDLSVRRLLSGVMVSNGLTWSLDGSIMYYIDSPTRRVAVYGYDVKHGELTGLRDVIDLSNLQGNPDGMTIDSSGYLWIALWGGGRVIRVNPFNKTIINSITVNARYTSSCTFGGGDLSTLFISTAMGEPPLEYEGYLFTTSTNVKGVRQYMCRY